MRFQRSILIALFGFYEETTFPDTFGVVVTRTNLKYGYTFCCVQSNATVVDVPQDIVAKSGGASSKLARFEGRLVHPQSNATRYAAQKLTVSGTAYTKKRALFPKRGTRTKKAYLPNDERNCF